MANAFMCKIDKQLDRENKLPIFYKRFVNDTLSAMPDPEAASEFLETLNKSHPSIDFTMDLEENKRLTDDKLHTSLSAKTIMAKLTNHV